MARRPRPLRPDRSTPVEKPVRSERPAPAGRPSRSGAGTTRVPIAVQEAQDQVSTWLSGARNSGFTLLVMGVMILAVVVLAPGVRTFVEQRQQIAALQDEVAAAQADADALADSADRWADPAYIKAQARDRLYYVMPGETSYLVLDDIEVAPSVEDPFSDRIQETSTDWLTSILTSVVVSGLTEPGDTADDGSTTAPADPAASADER